MPASPIEHVVIIFKENHTFDNYFGSFPGANGDANLTKVKDPRMTADPPHWHEAWLNAQVNGVVSKLKPAYTIQFDESVIPAYWDYARKYTLCDSYFTDVASQSQPNHLMAICADSPIMDNEREHVPEHNHTQPQGPFNNPTLPKALAAKSNAYAWRVYADPQGADPGSYFHRFTELADTKELPTAQFAADAAAGNLPEICWLYAPQTTDEHAPDKGQAPVSVTDGMNWTVQQVSAVASNQASWGKTAIFITWDDWGGWYDHVAAPAFSKWTMADNPAKGQPYTNTQFRYGPRVPCLVLSPYAKRGHVCKSMLSHVSLVKFCVRNWSLTLNTPYTKATDPSGDMWDCFDFTQTAPNLSAP